MAGGPSDTGFEVARDRVLELQAPGPELLGELRTRLTEAPECLPGCVTSPRMRIEASEKGLRIVQELHVAAPVGVPLPGSAEQWLPTSVIVDAAPTSSGLARAADGTLMLQLGPGRHEVVLEGPLPVRETVQIALPLKPHRIEAKAKGWTVEGVHEDGLADDNLQLTRLSPQDAKAAPTELEVGTLPPFVRLERSLALGLTWELTTRVVRLTPNGSAVVLAVPLLPGESVTTAEQRVEAGKVLVNMAPDQGELVWSSVLPIGERVTFAASVGEPWAEVWQVEVGPVWHVEYEGAPTVRQGEGGLREWRPWPGELVSLLVTRPQGVPGQTLTIDSARLDLEPGLRATDAKLELALRSSRGGHHVVTIPPDALLQQVTINGARQTIGQEGQLVRVPVEPGSQRGPDGRRQTPAVEEDDRPRHACRASSRLRASTRRSTCAKLWAADRVMRSRAAPLGTVGGRIAGTHKPSASRARETARVSWLSPMTTGWIGVSDGRSCQRLRRRPVLRRAMSAARCARRASPCSIRSTAVSKVSASSGGAPVVKM